MSKTGGVLGEKRQLGDVQMQPDSRLGKFFRAANTFVAFPPTPIAVSIILHLLRLSWIASTCQSQPLSGFF